MTTTQQYAHLSEHAYKDLALGVRPEDNPEIIPVGGRDYKILNHQSNPNTGYQGTVYQDVQSGEIIVAHRGTEPPGKDRMDATADALMVNSRTNIQAHDAIKLTKWAQDYAVNQQEKLHLSQPHVVTVTGHSLGGALAEITAHRCKVYGEAFNGYGAASLNHGVPEGQGHFVNHVMAGDVVGNASPHYGQVRLYASAQDMRLLVNHSYARGVVGSTVSTAANLLGDHSISNFTGTQGQANILNDPQALQRPSQNKYAVTAYHTDVANDRRLIGLALTSPEGLKNLAREAQKQLAPHAEKGLRLLEQTGQGAQELLDKAAQPVRDGTNRLLDAGKEFLMYPANRLRGMMPHAAVQQDDMHPAVAMVSGHPVAGVIYTRLQPLLPEYSQEQVANVAADMSRMAQSNRLNVACCEFERAEVKGASWLRMQDPAASDYAGTAFAHVTQSAQIPVQNSMDKMLQEQVAQQQALAQQQHGIRV